MAINTQTIRVDLNTGKTIPVAYAHQNDTNRQLTFTLYNNGVPYSPSSTTAKFAYKSPVVNGQYSVITGSQMATGTILANTVTVTLPAAYTAVSGTGLLTMILTTSGNTLRPVNIKFVVESSVDGDDVVLGASDWPEGLYDYMDDWLAENEPTEIANLKSDINRLNDGGLILKDDVIAENVTDWLDEHPEATTTVQDGAITYPKFSSALARSVYSLAQFEGNTTEEQFYNALDETDYGVILCGKIELNHVYTPISTKDYRNITVLGATMSINVDGWFDQSKSKSATVPKFDSCIIRGNNNTFYASSENVVGAFFRNCTLKNICIVNNASANKYMQSPYFIGCAMNPVENLFTTNHILDFRMIGCRIESGTETLCTVTGENGIMSGSVIATLIEGRHNVVFDISSFYRFEVKDCYFEANLNGLISQSTTGIAEITVTDCLFLRPTNVECAINIISSNRITRIERNLCNFDSGQYLCNELPSLDMSINQVNTNFYHSFGDFNGFKPTSNSQKFISRKKTGVWNADDNTWNFDVMNGPESANTTIHPFYVVFAGSFTTSAYQGYAIIRVTPRIAYNPTTSAVEIVCDATILDSCNSYSMTKTSTVAVVVDVNSKSYTKTNLIYSIKISGFSSHRGELRVIDPFTVVSRELL